MSHHDFSLLLKQLFGVPNYNTLQNIPMPSVRNRLSANSLLNDLRQVKLQVQTTYPIEE
jgi:hypothetical protein